MLIGMLLFPNLTQLDLTGPYEVFSRLPGAMVHLLWKDLAPVRSDKGLTLLPTTSFATSAAAYDVLFVPGGPGQIELMDDDVVLSFLRAQAGPARYVTSVCTGSLVLAAAGLLQGRRATCHWTSIDQLALLGAIPAAERVVRDGNIITGAGVTSGIDFALTVAAEVAGRDVAEDIQLSIEYDPAPPFAAGSPSRWPRDVVATKLGRIRPFLDRRLEATLRAAKQLL